MVKLALLSYKANANTRFFPHSGYLGLTPVKVEGVVRTSLEEDRRPLQAYSITVSVRCIEARMGRVGVVKSNVLVDYSQTLWSKPPDVESANIGDSEHPFKIVIPHDSPGYSNANFQDYRVLWRIEAVIHHAPIFGVGTRKFKSYEIPLVRYDSRVQNHDPLPCSTPFRVTQKPRAPVIRYQLKAPVEPVGPLDIVTIHLVLHPEDPSVTLRGASLLVERRIELAETVQLPASTSSQPWERRSPQPVSGTDGDNSSGSGSGSTLRGRSKTPDASEERSGESSTGRWLVMPQSDPSSSSLLTIQSTRSVESAATFNTNDQRPLLPPATMADMPAKTISLTVAHVESPGTFRKDASGVYSTSLTLQWPAPKSNSHWATGETMQTDMIRVRFFIHVKIIVSSPTTGTESIELEERELLLIATNESERKVALTKYADSRARSKSKSPRRTKSSRSPLAESSDDRIPSPIPPVPQTAYSIDTRNDHTPSRTLRPSTSGSTSTLRRPHTATGLRDKASSRSHRHHEHHRGAADDQTVGKHLSVPRTPRRPETAISAGVMPLSTKDASSVYPYPPTHARRSSREIAQSPTSPMCGTRADEASVRAWEEELTRVEIASRRMSSNVLGFNLKRLYARSMRPKTASATSPRSSESP